MKLLNLNFYFKIDENQKVKENLHIDDNKLLKEVKIRLIKIGFRAYKKKSNYSK